MRWHDLAACTNVHVLLICLVCVTGIGPVANEAHFTSTQGLAHVRVIHPQATEFGFWGNRVS